MENIKVGDKLEIHCYKHNGKLHRQWDEAVVLDVKDEYIVFDGMKMKEGNSPIRVPGNNYPYNYDDWMFASVNVLTKLDTTKYEWYGTSFKKYYNTTNPECSPFIGKSSNAMVSTNSIKGFHGIIFRKKKKNS